MVCSPTQALSVVPRHTQRHVIRRRQQQDVRCSEFGGSSARAHCCHSLHQAAHTQPTQLLLIMYACAGLACHSCCAFNAVAARLQHPQLRVLADKPRAPPAGYRCQMRHSVAVTAVTWVICPNRQDSAQRAGPVPRPRLKTTKHPHIAQALAQPSSAAAQRCAPNVLTSESAGTPGSAAPGVAGGSHCGSNAPLMMRVEGQEYASSQARGASDSSKTATPTPRY